MPTFAFHDKFGTEEKCKAHFLGVRWSGQPWCPYCGKHGHYVVGGGKQLKCKDRACRRKYSHTVATVFQDTNLPLRAWYYLMHSMAQNRSRTSSVELAKKMGISQKTTWAATTKLRALLKPAHGHKLKGIVEMDEAFFGANWSVGYGRTSPKKHLGMVIGLKQRGGEVRLVQAYDRKWDTLQAIIQTHIEPGSTVYTDGHKGYVDMPGMTHESVIHKIGEWVRGDVHTNGIEGVWGRMKKAIRYAHGSISSEHLQSYCNEFAWKENTRHLSDEQRFDQLLHLAIHHN